MKRIFVFVILAGTLTTTITPKTTTITEKKEAHYYGFPAMVRQSEYPVSSYQAYVYPSEQREDDTWITRYDGYIITHEGPLDMSKMTGIKEIRYNEEWHQVETSFINGDGTEPTPIDTAPLLNQIDQMDLQLGSAILQLKSVATRTTDEAFKEMIGNSIDQVTAARNRNSQLKSLVLELNENRDPDALRTLGGIRDLYKRNTGPNNETFLRLQEEASNNNKTSPSDPPK